MLSVNVDDLNIVFELILSAIHPAVVQPHLLRLHGPNEDQFDSGPAPHVVARSNT